jgi:putative NADPH-quinone reductase
VEPTSEQAAQRERALERLREALALVRAAHDEVRGWAPLSVMNDFEAVQAELRTILSRL